MPYIKQDRRKNLDAAISNLIISLKSNLQLPANENVFTKKMTSEDLLEIIGDINYCFSRISSSVMGDVSYSKVALITGVLENIKQEFYERIARPYEDKKIEENGDIQEYK